MTAARTQPRRRSAPRAWVVLGVAAALAVGCADTATGHDQVVHVYAAASTTDALNEVLAAFPSTSGVQPQAVVGASSAMARQIEHGAPADLFLSANPAWMSHLRDKGLVGKDTQVDLLENSLVVVVPSDSTAAVDLADPTSLLAAVGTGRLAMGDPDHVPAGIYAAAALKWQGAWQAVETKLARTADVRGALMLVERGEASVGIVYATDAAASDRVRVVATFPAEAHPPVTYPLAIVSTKGEEPGVKAVYAHMMSPAARAIFTKHGFVAR